ncbi:sugar-binding domain-containing protein [Algibacter pectinivorans]|uniref:Glycosyl hydrolases family 2, TIM barrel domain n=1 Tax=Algibacter pectinivorans TaxID=870482 RepID=A0A1I1Q544_9FLAO|nr:sugar-binding domain-containing protein [Algibacter pectinivorans]SFD17251.1 Glycosyl hydrolases family 2, TIM barrel domain [Algibacter pectinivorans]
MKFYRTINILTICLSILALVACTENRQKEIDLAGEWSFKIDSLDVGVQNNWFNVTLGDVVKLPGSMTENGKGNDITVKTNWTGNMWNDSLWYKDPKMKKYRQKGNVKIPFWLQPVKDYKGAAWYQKTVVIPEDWNNQNINLHLERVHWESTVWVDDKKVGMQNTLATSHDYSLTGVLNPGEHTISIRVDNRIKDIDVGKDAHSISDNTQSNWNGIVGDIKLSVSPKLALGTIKLYPNVSNKTVKVVAQLNNSSNAKSAQLIFQAKEKSVDGTVVEAQKKDIQITENKEVVLEYNMGDNPKLWDEFNPNLYEMQISLQSDAGVDTKSIDFGMRDFKAEGTVFTINERPLYLRGTLECAIFPKTGYPPTDVDSWKRIFKIIKAHGLNHMRFHSWCPPEAAFQAADEMGVYIQAEASAWLANLGDGNPVDKWLYKEGEAIIDAYGNHPSFVLMTYGNEPSGKHHKEYLIKYVNHFKELDNRRLYTSGAGYPYLGNMDYYNHRGPRIQGWNENLKSIINAKAPQTEFDWHIFIDKTPMPYVSHEMGQWCVYPNFKEMSKYTGVLKPKNFEIFKETLEYNGMGKLANEFLLASGKLQTLCYKADIEAALRTKGMAGYQLLDLHDFSGQGTALVGVLDAFWDEKGYVSPEEFRAFSGKTVPLARLKKRTFKNTDTLLSTIEIAHFGENRLQNVTPRWSLTKPDGSVFDEGSLDKTTITIGNGIALGSIKKPLKSIDKAQKLTLNVMVNDFKNSWDIWVYPEAKASIKSEINYRVASKLDAKTMAYLNNGGTVLLNITKGDIAPEFGGDIGIGFSSIFWNTSWTKEQKPHTLGILCNPEHPALANFPTEYHSNWQWWDAMSHSNAIIFDEIPKLNPIVRVIDDWFKNRKIALIFEAKVGKGKILFSGIDLHTDIADRLEAQQLLYSLKRYVASDAFNPKITIDKNQLKKLLKY